MCSATLDIFGILNYIFNLNFEDAFLIEGIKLVITTRHWKLSKNKSKIGKNIYLK